MALLALAVMAATTAGAVGVAAAEGEAKPFSHVGHVPVEWADKRAETARDCRGCHDYSSSDPTRTPAPDSRCELCHAFGTMQKVGTSRVDVKSEESGAFRHHDHLKFEAGSPLQDGCKTCHTPVAGKVEDTMPMPSPSGLGLCRRCHSNAADSKTGGAFLDKLNARLESGASTRVEPSRFRHDEHIPADKLASADRGVCVGCHADMAWATARDIDEKQFTTDTCKKCHTQQTFTTESISKPSGTAATFLHIKHLSAAALEKNPRLAARGCLACHEYDAGRRDYAVQANLRDHAYSGCITCHAERTVENHGRIETCKNCHAFEGQGTTEFSALKETRPKVEVTRADPAAFTIGAQSHPFISTGKNENQLASCAECHVARIPARPSNIPTSPFSHATHLPKDVATLTPSSVETLCTRCHDTIKETVRPGDLQGSKVEQDSKLAYVFDIASCTQCHATKDVTAQLAPDTRPRFVPNFSHYDHLRRKYAEAKRDLTCVDCHVAARNGGEVSIQLQPDAAACTKCHDHAQFSARTAHFDQRMVDSCKDCHRTGIPGNGVAVPVARLHLKKIDGWQEHDGRGDCNDCHLDPSHQPPQASFTTTGSTIAGVHAADPIRMHNLANPAIKAAHPGDPFMLQSEHCFDCHWGRTEVPRVKGRAMFQQQSDWKETQMQAIRDAHGNDMKGFPGLSKP